MRRRLSRLLTLALLALLPQALGPGAGHALVTPYFVDGPFFGGPGFGGNYDNASITIPINPATTSWVAWNDTPTVSRTDALFPGQKFLWGGNGTDDFINLKITNPAGTQLIVAMDQNNAFGVASGPQQVIFGAAAAAPDTLRIRPQFASPPLQRDVFNEAGAFNSIFTTSGDYTFNFAFNDSFPGGFGHTNVYVLVNSLGAPGGGGQFFAGKEDQIVIEGDGVQRTELGASHGFDLQVFGGLPPRTKSNMIEVPFEFNLQGGGNDPTLAYVHMLVEGRLIADNQGSARVSAGLQLLDLADNVLGQDSIVKSINSNLHQLAEANVYETLSFSVLLTPGQTYVTKAMLELFVSGGALGAGRAFFADTYEWMLSGNQENPFFDPTRQTIITERPLPDGGGAVPGPATFILVASGLIALHRLAGRSQRME